LQLTVKKYFTSSLWISASRKGAPAEILQPRGFGTPNFIWPIRVPVGVAVKAAVFTQRRYEAYYYTSDEKERYQYAAQRI